MKKIYLLLATLVASLGTVNAQNIDLELVHIVNRGNPITIAATNPPSSTFIYMFINRGTVAATSADTVFLSTPYARGANAIRLTLPTGGIPVNDTVYYLDTAAFITGPAAQMGFQWCDSAWLKGGPGRTLVDGNLANNKTCASVQIINTPTSIGELVRSSRASIRSISVYPNPAVNSISFDYNFGYKISAATVTVRDLVGRVVYTEDLGKGHSGLKKFTINSTSLTSGMYMVEVNAGDTRSLGKVLIQK